MAALYTKMGVKGQDNLKLCYNPKIHGYASSTMYQRCANKGKLFLLMRRNSNGRVFGGHQHVSLTQRQNYVYGNSPNAWLWTINKDTKKVDILRKKSSPSYEYYFHSSYHLTWGAGHDLYCNSNLQGCNANCGHDYDTNGRGYHTGGGNGAKVYMSGAYNWNHREGGSHGMVYEVYTVN